jgi:haloalkane dehalogenase
MLVTVLAPACGCTMSTNGRAIQRKRAGRRLLHGNPSWSYLYRPVIPPLVAAGHRCVAPDLVGFGKSDKIADRFVYTYQCHVDWLRETVFDRLDLRNLTMVCHDWGGMLMY